MSDDLREYRHTAESERYEKRYLWQTAVGLQDVDGLETSDYLKETARKNIEGEISTEEAVRLIESYYKDDIAHSLENEEADRASARIVAVLSEKDFVFSPDWYISVHKSLFGGIYTFAGQIRNCNITKKERVLDGDTVIYGEASELRASLDYAFERERNLLYDTLSGEEKISRLADFVSGLWQIHIFKEGNTRTTAVFLIKYLRSLGYDVKNPAFAENARYFRNSLVRANYSNHIKGVYKTTEFLELFLRNLVYGENNTLSNRTMYISGALPGHRGGHKSAQQAVSQMTPPEKIIYYCSVPRSKAEIMKFCGYDNSKYFTERYLQPLIFSGKIKMTIPGKPNNRNQKYYTEKKDEADESNSNGSRKR